MKDPKENSYGVRQEYEVGDTVKVWSIFKNPIGTIERIVEFDAFPIKYVVRYTYEDTGIIYTEKFDSTDLTLMEHWYKRR